MITEERWLPGTSFPLTLERTDVEGEGRCLTVNATVVRAGEDGVGFSFIPMATREQNRESEHALPALDLTQLAKFLNGLPFVQPSRN